MKPLSIGAVAFSIATVTLVVCSAFRPNPASRGFAHLPSRNKTQTANQKKDTWLYWYAEPQDTYNDFQDIMNEEAEWEIELQADVDENPGDAGIEIAAGYMNTDYPHDVYAGGVLYVHYY